MSNAEFKALFQKGREDFRGICRETAINSCEIFLSNPRKILSGVGHFVKSDVFHARWREKKNPHWRRSRDKKSTTSELTSLLNETHGGPGDFPRCTIELILHLRCCSLTASCTCGPIGSSSIDYRRPEHTQKLQSTLKPVDLNWGERVLKYGGQKTHSPSG